MRPLHTNQHRRHRDTERLHQHIDLSLERIDNQTGSLSRFNKMATNIQVCRDNRALHSQSDLEAATSTRRQTEQSERQQEISPNNPIALRTNVEKDQVDRTH